VRPTKLKDERIVELANRILRYLRRLGLRNNWVTAPAFEQLEQALPRRVILQPKTKPQIELDLGQKP
jgi:hypothetical protein